jgi:hypothetical protein
MINLHVQIGYEGYTSWGAQNYTLPNVLDHLQREAFYGIAVTQSVSTSPAEASIQFQRDQQDGKFPPARGSSSCPVWRRPTADQILTAQGDYSVKRGERSLESGGGPRCGSEDGRQEDQECQDLG